MHGNVHKIGNTIHWTHREVTIPKCSSCSWTNKIQALAGVLLSVVFLASYIVGLIVSCNKVDAAWPLKLGDTNIHWPVVLNVVVIVFGPMILFRILNKEYFKVFSMILGGASEVRELGCLIVPLVLTVGSPVGLAAITANWLVPLLRGYRMQLRDDFPLIRQLTAEGWKFGQKPT
jgi:hypothetical protein